MTHGQGAPPPGWDEWQASLNVERDKALEAFVWVLSRASRANRIRAMRAEASIDERFGHALDGLEQQVVIAENIFKEGWKWLGDNSWTPKPEAFVYVTRRACATARQVLTLLRDGYPDGGVARWRTLRELYCVALLLARTEGEQVAERYLALGAVHRWKVREALDAEPRIVTLREHTDEEREQLRADYERVRAAYPQPDLTDRTERNSWWWAGPAIGDTWPTFSKVQAFLGVETRLPMLQANAEVHGGVGSAVSNTDWRTAPFGPVDDGAQMPGQATVSELRNIIQLFCAEWSRCNPMAFYAPGLCEAYKVTAAEAEARWFPASTDSGS